MCGIWGLITNSKAGLYKEEEDFLYQMMIAGSLRGAHGTGTYWIDERKPAEVDWMKIAGNPYNLIEAKGFKEYWNRAKDNANVFVGHNRYATKGAQSTSNAHPFIHKHITMVHNGTIIWGLSQYDNNKKIEVDSHALTIALAEEGTEILQTLSGAFACVWHNAEDETINIARNTERPLSMVKCGNSFYFASESAMLLWAMYRAAPNKKLEQVEIKPHQHYKFNIDSVGDPEVSPLPEKKEYGTTTVYYPQSPSYQDSYTKSEKKEKDETTIFTVISKERDKTIQNVKIFTYLCVTDNDEACWFRSPNEYKEKQDYVGTIRQPVILGKYNTTWTKGNTPWYKIDPNTILEVDKTERSIIEMKNRGCLDCGAYIMDEEVAQCDTYQVSPKEKRLLCPTCVEEYNLILDTKNEEVF